MGIRALYGNPFPPDNETFGVITGTYALSQFPNVYGKLFKLKAKVGNTSPVYFGSSRSTGSYPANPILPWFLAAGAETDWFSAENLNQYYQAGASGSCYLFYWAQG